ncbi:hypothetical protein [Photorhabdus africana]|uniref:hypothetical protein n=1 Tax=Photorhabdus africana TaxID=3097554 RepID=UPI002B41043F|nr:hypothetical protein [Photorhabdus sp. CRI-LC]
MSEKKGFIARLFGKQETSACCAMRIEAMTEEAQDISKEKNSDCCKQNTKGAKEENQAPKNV